MNYDDDEQIEEKSFKISGNDDPDEMFHDDTEDPLGPGADDDLSFNDGDEPEEEEEFGAGESY